MRSWLESDSAPTPTLAYQAAPTASVCDYGSKPNVDVCGTEQIPGATLFIKGKGDLDSVDANDIRQGAIGDCHLLAPTIAMLQSPAGRARMHDMIKEVERDGKTAYEVTFRMPVDRNVIERWRGGPPYKDVKVEVTQDFVKGHAGIGDTEGTKNEIWPLVLESAYAKAFGGVEKIQGGKGTVGLSNLTGKKAIEETLQSGWLGYGASRLQDDFASGKPMLITFTRQGWNNGEAPEVPAYAAYGFHCYAVTDVFVKDGETYVQLKNPWGQSDPAPIPLSDLERLQPQVSIGQWP